MSKERKYSYDKFIKIKFITTCDNDQYLFEIYDDNEHKNKLVFRETFINTAYITEITPVKKEMFYTKNYHNYTSTKELPIFLVFMSDGKKFYLLQSEYKKFKDIING